VVVVEMLGVVNEVTPVPPVKTAPPDAAAYQSIVSPEPGVADRPTVPVPHLEPAVPVGAVGKAFTVVVILIEVAGEPETQAADEVIITETTSLFANAVVV
jgi:hypothetical protein